MPKGVPLEPGEQHLAVHVEDHPLEYATFAGEIPKGQYGGGTVEIWDNGTYELLEEKKNGGLTVRLHGRKLEGTWTLVPAHLGGNEKNWLILRKRDDAAPAPRRSGQTYKPMLATLAADVPRGAGWTFEVKWDGYRAIATESGGDTTLTQPERERSDGAIPERREGDSQGGQDAGLRPRRRGMCAGRIRPFELLGDAAGQGGNADRLLRLRRARDRGRTGRRSTARRAQEAARGPPRPPEQDRASLRNVRRRAGAAGCRQAAAARGDHGQTPRLEISAGQANPRLAEDQDPLRAGVRRRRLHQGNGAPSLELRRAGSRLLREQRARVRRQRRHRLQQQGDREAAGQAATASA